LLKSEKRSKMPVVTLRRVLPAALVYVATRFCRGRSRYQFHFEQGAAENISRSLLLQTVLIQQKCVLYSERIYQMQK
jgi:hypothetical protein